MDAEEEGFVFYGTRIEREEDAGSRKRKAVAEASGQLRTLVPWKQEVRDEQGRRRFHGAFTGGYSAGYYNTVGSREGWTPQSFTSSRKNRAEIRTQSVDYFLDDEERAEMEGRSFAASNQFDTFGFTSRTRNRPSAIPGPVPDKTVVPATESVGVKLLMKMGWRRGRSIALFALSGGDGIRISTPVYVINPKQDVHGLGYGPFKDAPEFREKKRRMLEPLSVGGSLFGFKSRRVAPGFGIGALEDLDVEDEDIFAAYDFEEFHAEEIEEPSRRPVIENVKLLDGKKRDDVLPGFKAASNSEHRLERFGPPVIPIEFVPNHRFTDSLAAGNKLGEVAPPEVSPPGDNCLRLAIEGMATLVARCGNLFEDLSRQKNQSNQSNPLFSFLFGGSGQDYYARKLWEGRHKHDDKQWQWKGQNSQNAEKMTAENRGRILGEKPLERSLKHSATSVNNVTLQFNLSDTFTTAASFTGPAEAVKPFQEDPEKQERYEQFLKEKYRGGLRTKDTSGSSKMTEAARVRERLEFDAAAQAIEKGNWRKESKQANKLSEGDLVKTTKYPKREEFQWRPSSLLCECFDLTDPYVGKLPPPPRPRSKMDALIVMSKHAVNSHVSQMGAGDKTKVDAGNIERHVDLYKAIFSDDSDDDENRSADERDRDIEQVICRSGNNNFESASREKRETKAPSHQNQNRISDFSEDKRERKCIRQRRKRSYSDSEASDDSRSKEKRKRSSQEKSSSSRRHSKHHKHRHGELSEKERKRDKNRHKYKD